MLYTRKNATAFIKTSNQLAKKSKFLSYWFNDNRKVFTLFYTFPVFAFLALPFIPSNYWWFFFSFGSSYWFALYFPFSGKFYLNWIYLYIFFFGLFCTLSCFCHSFLLLGCLLLLSISVPTSNFSCQIGGAKAMAEKKIDNGIKNNWMTLKMWVSEQNQSGGKTLFLFFHVSQFLLPLKFNYQSISEAARGDSEIQASTTKLE